MLEGKVAVVTGGAKGIGRYIATTFAQAGARAVAVADVDAERLNRTAGELADLGAETLAVTTDVRDEDSVRGLMSQVVDRFGRLDVLVNNAGIVPHFQWGVQHWPAIRDMDLAFWDRVIRTNLYGTFLCTKQAIPYMERQGGGHIISLHGGGGIHACAYMVSKDAIWTFTRYTAMEVRDANICVVVMSPGAAIATEDAPEEARQRMPGPDYAGNRFVLAATAPMELSGKLLTVTDGRLEVEREAL
jgi:3-oxoacyl-[acyl-carrier protein] reductase